VAVTGPRLPCGYLPKRKPGIGHCWPELRRAGAARDEREPEMVLEYAKRHAERVSGVSNVTYDLLATMTRKLEGIAALAEYILDASQARDQEVMAHVERL
jgi:hypothetical protein